MATKFVKDQQVKAVAVVPQGPVQKLRMDEDGVFWYLISWTDAQGQAQERWFREEELTEA
jgi:hypothetical protein